MPKVCVALSGGVDSAAAAILLLKEGHQVKGITMETGYNSTEQAQKVAESLSIPLQVQDLRREFEEMVVKPTVEHYKRLITPNPCTWCNLRLKFDLLLSRALEDAELYATGHYACVERIGEEVMLKESASNTPSQTYFLALIPKSRLSRVLFPLCNRSREEAESLVKSMGVSVQAERSRDLCFLPPEGLSRFLRERGVPNPQGRIVDTSNRVLGQHRGLCLYTLGQRRGLGAGGTKERRYVVGYRTENGELVVGPKEKVLSTRVRVGSLNWLAPKPGVGETLTVRLRYRQRGTEAEVLSIQKDALEFRLLSPAVVVPGQIAVFNRGDQVLGGGEIEKIEGVG